MNTTLFNIYFDGGITSPVAGYGSWEVTYLGFSKRVARVPFLPAQTGVHVTCNTSEYLALEGALRWLQSVKDKGSYRLLIHGDSKLTLYTLDGRYRTKKLHLKQLRNSCQSMLAGWAGWETKWQGRENSVRRFGH